MKILKHTEDRRSVATIGLTLALQVGALFIPFHSWGWAWAAAWFSVTAFMCCVAMVVNHNHIHVPFFVNGTANRVFSVFLSIAEGMSSKFLMIPHNLNHHVYTGKKGDWCNEENAGDPRAPGFLRMTRYIAGTWKVMFRERFGERAPKVAARFRHQEMIEHVAVNAFGLTALWVNPFAFLAIIFPAWMIGAGFITLTNLAQHEETDENDDYASSRNFVGAATNWVFFNAGYHTAHHLKPAIHWTQLPGFHAQIAQKIPARLNEPSMVRYLARKYFFNLGGGNAAAAHATT